MGLTDCVSQAQFCLERCRVEATGGHVRLLANGIFPGAGLEGAASLVTASSVGAWRSLSTNEQEQQQLQRALEAGNHPSG